MAASHANNLKIGRIFSFFTISVVCSYELQTLTGIKVKYLNLGDFTIFRSTILPHTVAYNQQEQSGFLGEILMGNIMQFFFRYKWETEPSFLKGR